MVGTTGVLLEKKNAAKNVPSVEGVLERRITRFGNDEGLLRRKKLKPETNSTVTFTLYGAGEREKKTASGRWKSCQPPGSGTNNNVVYTISTIPTSDPPTAAPK